MRLFTRKPRPTGRASFSLNEAELRMIHEEGIVRTLVMRASGKEPESVVHFSNRELKSLGPLLRLLGFKPDIYDNGYIEVDEIMQDGCWQYHPKVRTLDDVLGSRIMEVSNLGYLRWRPLDLIIAWAQKTLDFTSYQVTSSRKLVQMKRTADHAEDIIETSAPTLFSILNPSLHSQVFLELANCYLSLSRRKRARLQEKISRVVWPGWGAEQWYVGRFICLSREASVQKAMNARGAEIAARLRPPIEALIASRADTRSKKVAEARQDLEELMAELDPTASTS